MAANGSSDGVWQTPWGPEARERTWDSRVEVVDPERADVLCSRTFTEAFVRFESAGVLYRRTEQSNGIFANERWTIGPVPRPQ
jgi:hypothetical protein